MIENSNSMYWIRKRQENQERAEALRAAEQRERRRRQRAGNSGIALVRRTYRVPAYRGREIVFTGLKFPVAGRILSSNGQYIWIRTNEGQRFGPLHPTWKVEYIVSHAEAT